MEKLYQKRIVWISFVIIFLLLVPVLFSQALGYKYNWGKHQFEATGILFVKTYPRDVQIILNNQLVDEKTPWQQAKLLPGRYNLKITKQNYLPWEKNINIYEHSTTFVEDVVLYKRSLPTPISKIELTSYLTSNDSLYIFLGIVNNKQILVRYNVNNHNWDEIKKWKLTDKIELLSLAPNSTKLIYSINGIHKLLLLDNLSIDENLTGLSQVYWSDIVWDSNSDNIIYSRVGSRLNEINISTMPAVITSSVPNIIDYFSHEEKIYYLQIADDKQQIVLNQATRGFANKKSLLLLPYTSSMKYVPSEGLLTLLDQINNFLYLIDLTENDIIAQVYPNVSSASWYNINYDKILYWNTNEISVYFRDRKQSELITRMSKPIVNAWWHPNGAYIFYQQDNKIHIIEFDARDKKNNYELVTLDTDDPFIINSKGDEIIYYSADDKTIYKQIIQ